MTFIRYYLILSAIAVTNIQTHAQVRLPRLISDGMVLQRDKPIILWGWASPEERITITFGGRQRKTTATSEGRWTLAFPQMKAGGPYTMKISARNQLVINDILIGDVWLCSGQSNMVHQLNLHDVTYAQAIASANYPQIRHIKIPTQTNLAGIANDVGSCTWQRALPAEVRSFSAVAYFFALKLYEQYHIPIGLVNASVGGTPIEAWINEDACKEFPDILKTIQENKDTAFVARHLPKSNPKPRASIKTFDRHTAENWYDVDFVPANWRTINIPGYWEDQGIKGLDGIVWYRKEIHLPASMANREAKVYLGRIIDADKVYINGKEIGNTSYQYPQRRYTVPSGVLKAGKNIFTIQVTNHAGKGGFVPDKPYYIFTDRDTVDLKGSWAYKVAEVFLPPAEPSTAPAGSLERTINPQNEPAALYNGMVGPITSYSIKGVLWYQGESNIARAQHYTRMLQALISGWRNAYKKPDLCFIYAQLPNFGDVSYLPEESNWAVLRASQREVSNTPNTAMTVNIDLGEWNDIHPDNKKEVGERMALAARKVAYGENIVHLGPVYHSHTQAGNKVSISFANAGSGLNTKDGGALKEFAIAGADKRFVWADTRIVGNTVIVWNDEIPAPKYIRYAWADNPDNPNLYNNEGLPASPFEISIP